MSSIKIKKKRPDYLPCAYYMRKEKKVRAGHHLIGKHVVMISAWPDFKEVVEARLNRLKQTPSNLHDLDMYRIIPFDLVYRRITTIKVQGFIIVRKLLATDRPEHIRPELARAYKTKQLILSLWDGYHKKLNGDR